MNSPEVIPAIKLPDMYAIKSALDSIKNFEPNEEYANEQVVKRAAVEALTNFIDTINNNAVNEGMRIVHVHLWGSNNEFYLIPRGCDPEDHQSSPIAELIKRRPAAALVMWWQTDAEYRDLELKCGMVPDLYLPRTAEVANELKRQHAALSGEGEVRLQVLNSSWDIHTGDPQYDLNHRGYWGSSYMTDEPMTDEEFNEMANDLLNQVRDSYHQAQGVADADAT